MKKKSFFKSFKDGLSSGLSGKGNPDDARGTAESRNWAKEQFFGWSRWGNNQIVMKMGN